MKVSKKYLLIFLFPLLCMSQVKIKRNTITIDTIEYKIIEKVLLYKDTVYKCDKKTVFRRHDSILYLYGKKKYIKYKI